MDAKNLFSVNRKSSRINESLSKKFGTRLNLESFDLQQLEDSRNRLRTQISQIRQNFDFNENLENDSFIKAQFMLDAINAEIEERDEHIVEADVEEGKMKDLHQDVEEYLAYMSDVFNDREEYDLAHELHNLSFELEKVGIGGVMKELKQLTYWGDPLAKGVYKEFSKKFGKFAEGFDGDLEEGKHEVDYDLHQLALYGDEEDLIDALGGDQGPHVAEALKDMMEELKDELASKGMNDVMRDEDKMIEMLADKLFDEYGEDGEEYGDMDPRYDRSDSDADADALKSAGFGSDEDYESVQNEKAPDVVRNIAGATTAALGGLGGALLGNMFAPILGGVAGAIGGAIGGAKVGSETADAVWDQVSSMLGGEKKATEAGIAHAKAAKAGESSFEFDGKEYEVTLKPQEVGKAVADLKAVKEAYNESVQRSDERLDTSEKMNASVFNKATKSNKYVELAPDVYFKQSRSIYDEHETSFRTPSGEYGYATHMHEGGYPSLKDIFIDIKDHNSHIKDLSNAYIKNIASVVHAHIKKNKLNDVDESVEQGDEMTRVTEGEVQQASAIVTAKTMVDRVGRWIEELSGMENETLLQLGDSIRDEMGQEQARAFIESVAPAIQQALEILKSTRETLSTGVNTLATGEAPADMLGAEPAPEAGAEGDMEEPAPEAGAEGDMEEPAGDEFTAAEPAAGGAEAAGREQRENVNYENRLLKVLAG
jgi:hypothetical protein